MSNANTADTLPCPPPADDDADIFTAPFGPFGPIPGTPAEPSRSPCCNDRGYIVDDAGSRRDCPETYACPAWHEWIDHVSDLGGE